MTGERRWYTIGYYLATGDRATIRNVEAAMNECPRGAELISVGDFNINFECTRGQGWYKEIAAVVEMTGLEDILGRFLLQRRT